MVSSLVARLDAKINRSVKRLDEPLARKPRKALESKIEFSASTQICEDFRVYMAHVTLGGRDKAPQQLTLDPAQPASIAIEEHNSQQATLNDCAARRESKSELSQRRFIVNVLACRRLRP